jgi:hypothetical protein
MRRVMDLVLGELALASAWMTTTEICEKMSRKRGSVGRALRRLEARDSITKLKVLGDEMGNMEWAIPSKLPLPHAAPKVRPKKLGKTRRVHMKHPVQMLSINLTNQGDLQMHIETGAEAIVVEWVAAEKTFSAHDVTEELRKRVNDGAAQLDPALAGTTHVGGKDVTKVEHTFVKAAVTKLMSGNRFPDYVREHNPGGFYEYKPIAKSAGLPATAPDPAGSSGTPPAASGSSYDGSSTL